MFSLLIGQRLREERLRLGMSQEEFGVMGGVTKRAQLNYETGIRSPDTNYLFTIASIGEVDVQYVITGKRSTPVTETLSDKELSLLGGYRQAKPHQRKFIEDAVAMATQTRS